VIGIIGLGTMGSAMARRFAEQGTEVVATSRSQSSRDAVAGTTGVDVVRSPRELVAALAERSTGDLVVLTSLPSGPQVTAVADAVLAATAWGAADRLLVLVDSSTCAPADAQALAHRFATCGHVFVDAPVSGGPTGARDGTLSIMVGADADRFAQVAAAVAPIAGRVVHCGPSGCGQVTKAANQLIVACTVEAVAEALTLAARNGVDPATARTALLGGYAASRVLELQGERMVTGNFTPGGTVALLAKDVRIAQGLATAAGLATPALDATAGQVRRLAETDPGIDHSALVRLLGGWA
jgi:2-hydroxy-3-oxopropionate reductase